MPIDLSTRPFTAVLMGGPSSEREVSLRSGHSVAEALRSAGLPVAEVEVGRDGSFELPAETQVAFVALHGQFGEDGQIQALLEARGIPHTGSSPAASANAFDKSRSKPILAAAGVPTAPYQLLRRGAPAARELPLPLVVKPTRQGSSVGVSRVFREEDWAPALSAAFAYDETILAETFIPGRELTVPVIASDPMPVVEIVAPNDNYDYDTKYSEDPATAAKHLIPAPLDEATTARAQSAALAAYRALGITGMGRVDMRLRPDGGLYVLELNNIPGLTPVSLVPDAARAVGWTFPDLCLRILSQARNFAAEA
ncbi:MAG: D-alanine--D-alanine ligase [Kiritimatiellae bacterium]|nr:D-alanine--D-alanine ligase [Kiritimatiellia bacterium]